MRWSRWCKAADKSKKNVILQKMSHFRSSQLDRSHYGLSLACLLARPPPPPEKYFFFFSHCISNMHELQMQALAVPRSTVCFVYVHTYNAFFAIKVSVREFDTHIYITHHFTSNNNGDGIIIRGKNIVADVYFSIRSVSISPSRSEPPVSVAVTDAKCTERTFESV